MITNALTIDVEDYFQVHAFSGAIHREDWDSFEPRVQRNTHRMLDLLDSYSLRQAKRLRRRRIDSSQYQQETEKTKQSKKSCLPRRYEISYWGKSCQTTPKATFFVLGWIAERFPSLVKEIHKRGHEVACHGYAHKCIFDQTREEFIEDVKRAKVILEDLTGEAILGYRAPSFSITRATLWSLEIIRELGFRYDSSIFPVKHDFYGLPNAPRFPCLLGFNGTKNTEFYGSKNCRSTGVPGNVFHPIPDSILEFPLTTIRFGGYNFPVAGGGYFRLFPYTLTRSLLKGINEKEGRPFIFYIHPWEMDPDIPKIDSVGILSRFRTYVNLNKTENRFTRLLSDFQLSSISDCFFKYDTVAAKRMTKP